MLDSDRLLGLTYLTVVAKIFKLWNICSLVGIFMEKKACKMII